MSKGIYYKIDCDECRRLGLTGTDKDVYFFVKSFKDGLTMGQAIMAEYLCTTSRTLRTSIDRLQRKGLLVKSASNYIINGGVVCTYKVCNPTEKSSAGCRKEFPQGTEKSSAGTPYINTSNIQDINTTNIQGDAPTAEIISISELVLIKWNEHYTQHFNTGYVPDYRNLTNDKDLISDAVKNKMQDFKKNPDNADEAAEFIQAMFEAMFSAADKWQKEHWTLHTVATQFNQLYNAIINRQNGNNNNSINEGISREYVERKMREAGLL